MNIYFPVMNEGKIITHFYFEEAIQNRKILFNTAIRCAKYGKVLYILPEELTELPQLSQDLNQVDRHYLKMITFLYAPNLSSLIESVITLPKWQNIPCTIILDDISGYCENNFQNACGIVALFSDTIYSCSRALKSTCRLYISMRKDSLSADNCNTLGELFQNNSHFDEL